MYQISIFIVFSVIFIYISRVSLLHPQSHGFYRFFAWECILAILLLNAPQWFQNPFSSFQLVSWLFLFISLFLLIHGVYLLRVLGKPNQNQPNAELLDFEKTTSLVTVGAYKYIRHPLYSSLLFLAWGAFLKFPSSWIGLVLVFATSLFLFFTAKKDEAECLQHFGNEYATYMQGTKRFIPFLF